MITPKFVLAAVRLLLGDPEVLGDTFPAASLLEGSVGGWERAVGQPESSGGAVPGVYGAFPLD